MSAGGETFPALAANGQTAEIGVVGRVRANVTGTFGSGTATLETKDPDGTWRSTGLTLTVDGDMILDAPPNCQNAVRVNLTGATAPTVNVWIQSELSR